LQADHRKPGRDAVCWIGAVTRSNRKDRIGPSSSRLDSGFGHRPLRPGYFKARMVKKRDETQCSKVPGFERPRTDGNMGIRFEELLHGRRIERPRFKLGCRLSRR